jgi:hypothetical protein
MQTAGNVVPGCLHLWSHVSDETHRCLQHITPMAFFAILYDEDVNILKTCTRILEKKFNVDIVTGSTQGLQKNASVYTLLTTSALRNRTCPRCQCGNQCEKLRRDFHGICL